MGNKSGKDQPPKPPTAGQQGAPKQNAPTKASAGKSTQQNQGIRNSKDDTAQLTPQSANPSDISSPPPVAPITAGTGPVTGAAANMALGDYSHFNNKLSITDFDLLKVLGKGSFGKVMLVKKKDDTSGTLYAMKTLRKQQLVKRNQLAHTSTERYILQNIDCPFLVHLVFAFQTPDKLYMVLDFMAGGELFFWLKKDHKFSENRSRLYAAEITVAIEALHNVDIVYRDLKPENILLDEAGHLRLTDFGLAKGGITGPGAEGGTKTFCGTPEYLAPEILENKGHGKAVDWWALGTLLYEMLTGLPPFYDTNVQRMYHKILHEPLRFPKSEGRQMSEEAKELLRGLLERRIASRLGSGPSGAAELKQSRFFSVYDFNRILTKSYEAEFRPPTATSQTDVRNFDKEFTSEPAGDSLIESHMSETMVEKTKFEGFTYKGEGKLD